MAGAEFAPIAFGNRLHPASIFRWWACPQFFIEADIPANWAAV